MKTKIKNIFIASIIAIQSIIIPFASADFLSVRAYGTDTIAGYSSSLQTSLVNPAQNVVFVVEKPDGSVTRVPATADLEGLAQSDLYGHQTKTAGTYKLSVVYPGSSDSSPQSIFKIFPDQVSITQSDLSSTKQMVSADGDEKTFLTVTLFDAYQNPISNHSIQIISSRQDDIVEPLNAGTTDSDGRASFKVTSEYAGISVFTAIDSTLNSVLSDREEIIFFTPTKTTDSIGGSFLSANLLDADISTASTDSVLPGPIHHFEIEDLPSTLKVNSDQTFTVIAKDKDGITAKNYTGTILISTPDDEDAILPSNGEYTFKEADQGKFTFNLALRLTQIGKQSVQVFDKNNWKISGDYEVNVVPEQVIVSSGTSSSLSIKSPVDGSQLGNSLVIISGQGDPYINLKVFDNDIKIGDSETDEDGFFSYHAQNLLSGTHTFYAMSGSGELSSSISIQVDTLPPVLNYFEIDPEGVIEPGSSFEVVVQSEPNLEDAKIRIQGIEEVLIASDTQLGMYSANITAPVTSGIFPIDVILIDSLANKSEFLGKASIEVSMPKESMPPVVGGLEAVSGNSQVELVWEKVKNYEKDIQKYIVSYGTTFDELDLIAETDDDSTKLVISDLKNDSQYFFAVKAVDNKGTEGDELSMVIAVTPVATELTLDECIAECDDDCTNQVCADNGERYCNSCLIECYDLEVSDDETVCGIFTDTQLPEDSNVHNANPLLSQPIVGYSDVNSAILQWRQFDSVMAYGYKIYFGMQSTQYDDYIITPNNLTTYTVMDLIDNVPYYFAVVALDINGNEISLMSPEVAVVPGHATTHPTNIISSNVITNNLLNNNSGSYVPLQSQLNNVPETDKTGPETIWVIITSLIFSHFLYNHKKRVVKN